MNPTMEVQTRDIKGSRKVRSLRRQGQVPGVVYGQNMNKEPELVYLQEDTFRRVLSEGRKIFNLKTNKGEVQVLLKEVQVDEITDKLIHVDFLRVKDDDKIRLKVPLETKGEPLGIRAGGRLEVFLHGITIECTPKSLIESFTLDVTALDINEKVILGELKLPEGVLVIGQRGTPVCIVHPPKGSKGPETEVSEPAAAGAGGKVETKNDDKKAGG